MTRFNPQWVEFVKANPQMSTAEMVRALGIARSTVNRYKSEILGRIPKIRKVKEVREERSERCFSGCIPLPKCLSYLEHEKQSKI